MAKSWHDGMRTILPNVEYSVICKMNTFHVNITYDTIDRSIFKDLAPKRDIRFLQKNTKTNSNTWRPYDIRSCHVEIIGKKQKKKKQININIVICGVQVDLAYNSNSRDSGQNSWVDLYLLYRSSRQTYFLLLVGQSVLVILHQENLKSKLLSGMHTHTHTHTHTYIYIYIYIYIHAWQKGLTIKLLIRSVMAGNKTSIISCCIDGKHGCC